MLWLANKIKQKRRSNIWKLTDQIIQIKDINDDIIPDFSSRFNITGTFTCMRDMELNTSSIFVKKEDIEKFKNIKMIYDKEKDLVNLSILKKYVIRKDAYCLIANKVVPQAVNIKMVYYCNIMNINLYIQTTYRLQQDATLFKELLSFQDFKDNRLINLKKKENGNESNNVQTK